LGKTYKNLVQLFKTEMQNKALETESEGKDNEMWQQEQRQLMTGER
jgi:hypothetical protein